MKLMCSLCMIDLHIERLNHYNSTEPYHVTHVNVWTLRSIRYLTVSVRKTKNPAYARFRLNQLLDLLPQFEC